jgi:N-dimethylarginine dimethylaminohydrolase
MGGFVATDLAWGTSYLMTEPRHFTVCYHINPWMTPTVDGEAASAQWKELVGALERAGASVAVCPDEPGLPDMAFTMNAGFVAGRVAVPSRFRHPERQPEERHWRARFEALGLEVVDLPAPAEARFEAGDAFAVGDLLMGGYGFRSDRAALEALGELLGRPVVAARLVDERFYHTDTCFCPLGDGRALVFPGAFAAEDLGRLLDPLPRAVLLREDEALTFCANSVLVGETVLTATCPPRVRGELERLGLGVETVDVGEFHKSGGSVRCLTLPLDVPGPRGGA